MQAYEFPNGDRVTEVFAEFPNKAALTKAMDQRKAEVEAQGGTVTARRKIGRNEPCPCDSGKKFKRCCIQKFETGVASVVRVA